jgi:transposase-like protein
MRALDAGATAGEIARKYQLSPHLLHRWRGEWRAKGESAFPGVGQRLNGVRNGFVPSCLHPRSEDRRQCISSLNSLSHFWGSLQLPHLQSLLSYT